MELIAGLQHASAVRVAGKGVLILGASGTGKSSLALHLLALGGDLIADDRVDLQCRATGLHLVRPVGAPRYIECRGVGLLRADCVPEAPLGLVITCDVTETHRLPPLRWAACETVRVPLFHNVTNSSFPVAILQYFLHGRMDPDA